MGVYFVHLAGCTSLDVLCYEVFHPWPPIVLCDGIDCFGNSGMSGSYGIMKKGCYTPLKVVVSHNNQGMVLLPKVPGALFNAMGLFPLL